MVTNTATCAASPDTASFKVTPWVAGVKPGRSLPEWARTSFHATDGTVFVPAAIGSGGEMAVILCALYDGESTVRHLGHAYVPAAWLRAQYPHEADLIALIETSTKEAAAQDAAQAGAGVDGEGEPTEAAPGLKGGSPWR